VGELHFVPLRSIETLLSSSWFGWMPVINDGDGCRGAFSDFQIDQEALTVGGNTCARTIMSAKLKPALDIRLLPQHGSPRISDQR
jgi:hypothetical protein